MSLVIPIHYSFDQEIKSASSKPTDIQGEDRDEGWQENITLLHYKFLFCIRFFMNTGKIIPDRFIHPYFLLKIFLSQQSEDYGEK